MQKLNVRIVSFFLILLFSQKMGLELWLHNWLHETTVTKSVNPTSKDESSLQHQRVSCNCIDDALNPLMEADIVDLNTSPESTIQLFAVAYSSWLSAETRFSSLRGPPTANSLL